MPRTPEVFVAAHGQDDNVGDPALRRAMLEGLAPSSRRHVLVGAASHAYVSALGLRGDDVTYKSRRQWQLMAFRLALQGKAAFVSNAGEIQLNRRRLRINRFDRALIALIRARGGAAISTGLGVRTPSGSHSPVLTSLARACQIATWRDQDSRDFARAGVVRPDWAFALGSATTDLSSDARPLVVISMRGDSEAPSAEWMSAIGAIRDAMGLRIVVISQVERDVARGEQLAVEFGAALHPWMGGDHLAAEEDLRSVYRRARLVISDRLHVLIFAATEGAVPIYLPATHSTKIPRTMATVGLGHYQASAGGGDEEIRRITRLASTQQEVLARVDAARAKLEELSRSMNTVISGGRAS
ncbi:polysaccharide pyruvyl transferase family protein [Microbacterium sp. 1262]|uniref:polysaccharide pyruvyl transferase family protein n=1 Tax=Microbacterium sp. 1262 TaxID=3156415 RepID=UPI00339887FF